MKTKEFNELVTRRLAHCITVLDAKNKEYASDVDKLANFKEAGALKAETPEKALWGMWAKHIISVKKIVEDLDHTLILKSGAGFLPTQKTLDEKISDMINYALLLEGLIQERRNHQDSTLGV